MKLARVQPAVYNFTSLLKRCGDRADLRRGREIHSQLISNGFLSNVFAATAVLKMYANCRIVDDARKVFDRMPERDLVAWNALVSGYAQNGLAEIAPEMLLRMQEDGKRPDFVTLVSILPACASTGGVRIGKSVHGYAIRAGFESLVSISTALVDMYSDCGAVGTARSISAFSDTASDHHCGSLQILQSPLRISLYHPSILPLQTCKSMRELLQIQAHLITTGLISDPFAASRLLKASTSNSLFPLSHTLLLLRHIPNPDTFSVNITLIALSRSSDPRSAVSLYFSMLTTGFLPNTFTFPPLANACARSSSLHDGDKCLAQSIKRGAADAVPVKNAFLHMYANCGLVDVARAMFEEMPQRDLVSWNSMLDGYLKSNDLDSACELFDKMPERNVVSWNSMIAGFLWVRKPGRALKLFREMGGEGIRGTETTMVSVAAACGRVGRVKEGISVHGYFIRNFEEKNLIFSTTLVNMYSRCGRVDVARRVFDRITDRNLVCWNAMILGQSIHGCPEEGIALFDKMVERDVCSEGGESSDQTGSAPSGIRPDEVSFIGVLCACVRAGLLTEGKEYFNRMTTLYRLKPNFAHYWCMANLYGSLGLVQEAEEVLKSMPEERETLVLSCLLGSSRFRGDIQKAESIAKQLIELEPLNSSRYALLWNVYASAGRWEDAQKVKEMTKEQGITVMQAFSLFDLKEIVHNFKLGDRANANMRDIYLIMDHLAVTLKLNKTTPDSIPSS